MRKCEHSVVTHFPKRLHTSNQQINRPGENQISNGPIEPTQTEQHALFEVEEDETMSVVSLDPVIVPLHKNRSIFPVSYENYEPMERSYLIDSREVQTGSSYTLYPFAALLNENLMPSKIASKFTYFRANVSIKIQMIASMTTYGVVNAWTVPLRSDERACYEDIALTNTLNFKTWSGHSGMTLAIADQEGVEFALPWSTPETAYKLGGPNIYDKLADLYALNIVGAKVSNVTPGVVSPVVHLQVYARFTDVVLMGPTSKTTLATPVANLLYTHPESTLEDMPTDPVCKAVGQMETVAAAITGIEALRSNMNQINRMTQGMQSLYSDGQKFYESFTQEQEGLHPEMGETGQSNQRSGVKQSVYGDISSLYQSNSYANLGDHANEITVHPDFVADTQVEHDVYTLQRQWFVNRMFLSMAGQDWVAFAVHPSPGQDIGIVGPDDEIDAGYLPFFSRFYRYWRGNIDYRLQFFGSDLLTARILINVFFSKESLGTAPPTTAELIEQSGDVYSKTMTVRGTAEVEFSVPYVRQYIWSDLNNFEDCQYVTVSILDIVPDTVEAIRTTIPMYLSYRAGENFQYSSYNGGILTATPALAVGQGLINGENSSTSCTIFDGTTAPSTCMAYRGSTGSIYNLLLRPSAVYTPDDYDAPPGQYTGGSDVTSEWGQSFNTSRSLDKFASLFLYYTGSVRHKMYFRDFGELNVLSATLENISETSFIVGGSPYRAEYGQHATEATIWPLLEFESPYINTYAASQTYLARGGTVPSIPNPLRVLLHDSDQGNVASPVVQYVSIGKDFRFYFSLPPPNRVIPPARNNKLEFAVGQSWFSTSVFVSDASGSTYSGFTPPLLNNVTGENITAITVSCELRANTLGTDLPSISFNSGAYTSVFQVVVSNNKYAVSGTDFTWDSPQDIIPINMADYGGTVTGTFVINYRLGTQSGGDTVVIAGSTSDNPLWVSEIRPVGVVPPPDPQVTITGSTQTSPLWISRLRPN